MPTHDISLIIVGDIVDYSHKQNGIQIPSFQSVEWDLDINQVRSHDELFLIIIKAEPGEYLFDEPLGCCKNLPAYWKYGYAKGLAVNEKSVNVIY